MAKTLKARSRARQAAIFRQTNSLEARISRLMARKSSTVLGMAMQDASALEITAELESVIPETIALVTDTYTALIQWSYQRAAKDLAAILDPIFIARMATRAMGLREAVDPDEPVMPAVVPLGAEAALGADAPAGLVMKLYQLDLIPSGKETAYLAKNVVFPPLKADVVQAILKRSNWGDGLTYAQRLEGWGRHANFSEISARLRSGIAAGQNVTELEHTLRPLMDFDYQARRIARTESLRVAEASQRETWKDLGEDMEGVQIISVLGPTTRPEHADRHGTIYRLQPDGQYYDDTWGYLPELPDAPNCVVAGTYVSGLAVGRLKSWYSGEVCEILTAAGRRLVVTPNHPVLSADGFVPSGSLSKGDYLFADMRDIPAPTVVSEDKEQAPSVIENVGRSLLETGCITANAVAADLHGDEIGLEGKVEVICPESILDYGRRGELGRNLVFKRAVVETELLSGVGSHGLSQGGINLATPGGVGCGDLASSLVDSHAGPLVTTGIGIGAEHGSMLNEVLDQSERDALIESSPMDADFVGKLIRRFSGVVAADKIIDVRNYQYSGHVYDLQTVHGWYYANGVIIHNCLCWTTPVLVDAGPLV